jgi:hypothetical protein
MQSVPGAVRPVLDRAPVVGRNAMKDLVVAVIISIPMWGCIYAVYACARSLAGGK